MPTGPSAELRRRADELRRLAALLEDAPLAEIADRAGEGTWISPRATELEHQLHLDRRRLAGAVDDLRAHARFLERSAELADVVALTAR